MGSEVIGVNRKTMVCVAAAVLSIENGLITRHDAYPDALGYIRQMTSSSDVPAGRAVVPPVSAGTDRPGVRVNASAFTDCFANSRVGAEQGGEDLLPARPLAAD
jgi:hypothetical protein